ncbi:isoleucine--tRNA ligase [Jonesia denitrificans]|uniref:Isoleucine--tRNA ligase n=1 Tax=Jonesia denitrificans (strain ATCC 14870 / DSM 20603 / BCRC 15368 / CIP 55.134 / JCM 11481 / NBRC 15587 / NCTC 10816 / Prevot 55134) TaxID=471856 RepID=C7R304_JONDD|nr:isoleucine--tRNA ligase [Jonesia denitrificans]ACV08626.1 isoleucyl-tRNA synthetase [Jonesia denitrificans DSM 20603]ASE07757.1 isoleucine--tRNA ligase [Jonesia denitrificans]QXB42373.1 isoleucine--tRNA ligase [Jonesia denitrificans]SQH20613.1 Isoleucine--tRNA ligase [Jonesia denitrificans]
MGSNSRYPLHRDTTAIPSSPNFPAIEDDVLAYWATDHTFQASIDQRDAGDNGSNEFVFYDGPPFANGLPHYGHLLTGYAKDVVPRYQTMRGRKVERRFGWDTHGLPAELEAERVLGITDKSQIEEMGIGAFNEACRTSVLKYTKEWEEYVTRQARWVDFENDYKTLDVTFMESVIWAFKQLYDKGLAYEGHRVLPYCWRDETPLSNHELRMDDDVYQSRQDPALTVVLPLIGATGDLADASLLIWTTTPWTLPSNLAVAVGPDITYVVVRPASGEFAGAKFVVAEARLAAYARELGEAPEIVATLTGADLTGLHYQPPFRYFAGADNAHQVLAASFVTTEDGTGLVHLAPAFGEDDAAVCAEAGIATVVPVDSQGRFTPEVSDYQGVQVFDANPTIIRDLKERALVVRHETYQHSYPHCWRCRNPLIYKAVSSWFVRVTEFRDRMVELNEDVTWVPEHIKHGQFGKWLSNARDWSISRNRYFGTPIPVWVSDNPAYPRMDVYGSLADLERDFGRLPLNDRGEPDLHRPYIDDLTRPNPDDPTGQSTMRRIPDVLDVWFDSGSMPFAQVHYPFENADWFDNHYPGDFIVEYIGQTRGWFYTLHVLATALFDRPAFRTAVSHGIVLGSDGRKMSKSLRNYPDVSEVLSRDGADAMRWFLMSSPILRGGNLVVTEDGIRDSVRQVLLPVWSTYYFLTMYASAVGQGQGYLARAIRADEVGDLPAMDRYILARTRHLVDGMTGQLDGFDIAGACESVRDYLDELTNWYVRTQRDRFWAEDETAFNTLFTVMETLCRVLAPLAPLVSEEIWRGLTGGRSVHLVDWPDMSGELGAVFAPDDALVATMDELREAVSLALALRKAHALRVRQPLSSLTVVSESVDALAPYTGLLEGELNVRQVVLERLDESAAQRYGISEQLTVNARAAGPRLGRGVQAVIKAAKAGAWDTVNGEVVVHTADGDVPLIATEYDLVTVVDTDAADARAAAVLGTGGFIVLDVALSDELIAEGVARDVIRDVQEARKNAGLNVSDRIVLDLVVDASEVEAVSTHRDLIARETLATSVTVSAGDRKIAVAVTA